MKMHTETRLENAAIDRLTEYRTALITAATTGKIDVRNVKVPTKTAAGPRFMALAGSIEEARDLGGKRGFEE